MVELIEKYQQKLQYTDTSFTRSLLEEIHWDARLIGIKGARGVGKTTLLLQYIKLKLKDQLQQSLYVSLDNIWFSNNTLSYLVDHFVKRGGKFLFLDEVHKYPNWSQELKNIYDDYPSLKVVFTGSSLLEILNARADLSRRAIVYHMQGLSFREYIGLETNHVFPKISLSTLLKKHIELAKEINVKIKPLQYFDQYIQNGYYPFYKEQPSLYSIRIEEVINLMLEIELPMLRKVDIAYIHKIKQLLLIISESVPFIPNITKLSEKIGLQRGTLLSYLHYLDEIGLTKNIFKVAEGISKLQKPEKIFLENTNLMFALSAENSNKGNIRETFFVNQLSYQHKVNYAEQGDFTIDMKYTFEVGGKNKKNKQIETVKNAFVVADDIEYGSFNKIPLWMFGFLY